MQEKDEDGKEKHVPGSVRVARDGLTFLRFMTNGAAGLEHSSS